MKSRGSGVVQMEVGLGEDQDRGLGGGGVGTYIQWLGRVLLGRTSTINIID